MYLPGNGTNVGSVYFDVNLDNKDFRKNVQNEANYIDKSFSKVTKSIAKGFAAAFTVKAVVNFAKESINLGSDLAEVQNIVDTTFGSGAKVVNDFAKMAITSFGLTEKAAKQYTGTMGAMLKSMGLGTQRSQDMAISIAGLAGDLASFYNLDTDEAFNKIRSGIAGEVEPLRQIGVNLSVANIESYMWSKGVKKQYESMTEASRALWRYNYLMEVTADSQGDFVKTSHQWANQVRVLQSQWESFKASMGQSFILLLKPIVQWLNIVVAKLIQASQAFNSFIQALTGRRNDAEVSAIASAAGDASGAMDGLGDATDKAGKKAKKSVMGFDEVNVLMENTADNAENMIDGMGGIGFEDLNSSVDVDADITKYEKKIARAKEIFWDFYNTWGIADIFKGITDGLKLINFDSIGSNLQSATEDWLDIIMTWFWLLQPIWQSSGFALGTALKYGIAMAGNLFEPILTGFTNFTTMMKQPIQMWLLDMSATISSGIYNIAGWFEIIGQSWLMSINDYKAQIIVVVQGLFTLMSETVMFAGEIIADTFDWITGAILNWVATNRANFKKFSDDILYIITTGLNLINGVWQDALNLLRDFWNTWGKFIVDGAMRIVTDIGDWFFYLWNGLVRPIWNTMLAWLKDIWDNSLKDLVANLLNFVGKVAELIMFVWDNVLQPLVDKLLNWFVPWFKDAFDIILDIVHTVISKMADRINAIITVLTGVIDFIIGIFTGDWQRAWNGLKDIFKGTWDFIVSWIPQCMTDMIQKFRDKKQALIDVGQDILTWVWDGLKNIWASIAGWVEEKVDWLTEKLSFWKKSSDEMSTGGGGSSGGYGASASFGGKSAYDLSKERDADYADFGDVISRIGRENDVDKSTAHAMWEAQGRPQYAKGGIIDQPTLAMVGERHKKEAVIPLENTSFVDTLATALANVLMMALNNGNNQSTSDVIDAIINIDGTELARVLIPKIDSELVRMGYRSILQSS